MTKYTVSYEHTRRHETKIEAESPEDACAQFHKKHNLNYKVLVAWGPLGMNYMYFDAHLKTDEEAQGSTSSSSTASSSSGSSTEQQLLQKILAEQQKSNFRLSVIACPAWILLVNYLFSFFSAL